MNFLQKIKRPTYCKLKHVISLTTCRVSFAFNIPIYEYLIIETASYPTLEELLITKSWEEIEIFMPYLVCLLFSFQIPELHLELKPIQIPHKMDINDRDCQFEVYTSMRLKKQDLDNFQPTKKFAWNDAILAFKTPFILGMY